MIIDVFLFFIQVCEFVLKIEEAAVVMILSSSVIFLLSGCTLGVILGKYTKKRTSYQILSHQ
jgi:hypothetical protein